MAIEEVAQEQPQQLQPQEYAEVTSQQQMALEEVTQVYYDRHSTESTPQLVILAFLDRPSYATPLEAAIEK